MDILKLRKLEDRGERGNLMMMCKVVKGIQKLDGEDLLIRGNRGTRHNEYMLKKIKCEQHTFPSSRRC